MKKMFCILLSVLLFSGCMFAVPVWAVSVNEGDNALRAQFQKGNGGGLNYVYFAPTLSEGEKAPLVVWLHGIASGAYNGDQIDSYDICKWTSDEYQARFVNGGKAFLLAPQASGTWDLTTVDALKGCIDAFIASQNGKVDVSRIYLIGFSVGATMSITTAAAYPDFFAAVMPICAVIQNASNVKKLSNMAVWFFANEKDTYVSANRSATQKTFDKLINNSANKENKRYTYVTQAVTPTGGTPSMQHYMWRTVTNDMFMADNSSYAYATTVDGTGAEITFTYPNGIISWLSAQTNEKAVESTPSMTFGRLLSEIFRILFILFA